MQKQTYPCFVISQTPHKPNVNAIPETKSQSATRIEKLTYAELKEQRINELIRQWHRGKL